MAAVRNINARLTRNETTGEDEVVIDTLPGTMHVLSVPESQRLLMQLHSIDQAVRGAARKPTLRERLARFWRR